MPELRHDSTTNSVLDKTNNNNTSAGLVSFLSLPTCLLADLASAEPSYVPHRYTEAYRQKIGGVIHE